MGIINSVSSSLYNDVYRKNVILEKTFSKYVSKKYSLSIEITFYVRLYFSKI